MRQNSWHLAAVVLLLAGVLLPVPRWVHVTLFGAGIALMIGAIVITYRRAGSDVAAPRPLSPAAIRVLQVLLIPTGVCAAGYLTACISGHGGAGPIYSSTQIDNGSGQFGTGNAGLVLALGV